jgi:hypothetical protein
MLKSVKAHTKTNQEKNVMSNKSPITARALIQRINRKLAAKGEKLMATRGARAKSDLGDFFILDTSLNLISEKEVSLPQLAEELNVIKPYEILAE